MLWPNRTASPHHPRMIVAGDFHLPELAYSVRDDIIYELTRRARIPRRRPRSARIARPEDTDQELAGHLGVTAGGALERRSA